MIKKIKQMRKAEFATSSWNAFVINRIIALVEDLFFISCFLVIGCLVSFVITAYRAGLF